MVENLPAAVPLLRELRPGTVIVDCEAPCRPEAEMLAVLDDADMEARLVFLSLADNRMIVHQWRRLGDATSADLVSVLRNGTGPAAASGVIC